MQRRRLSGWMIVVLAAGMVYAQNDAGQQSGNTGQQSGEPSEQQPATTPPVAFGQEPPAQQVSKFPPLSGLDEASLEPAIAPRSFVWASLQGAETVDTNSTNALNAPGQHTGFRGSTRLGGMAGLQRLWSRYQLMADYSGGGALYTGTSVADSQLHRFDIDSRVLWRTGTFQLRDSVSYLPEGTFGGGTFGGVLGSGGAGGGLGGGILGGGGGGGQFNFLGNGSFGSVGNSPRLMNLTVADIQELLSPRSAITMSGAYNIVHYTKSTGGALLDSRQITAQAGYNYAVTRRDSLAVAYAFQSFRFPTAGGGGFETHVIHFLYGHQISGRMDVVLGGGPQLTRLSSPATGTSNSLSLSGRFSLRYRFPKTSLSLTYNRFNSAGSGFVAGAVSDVVNLAIGRPLGRRWSVGLDAGYSHNKRLQNSTVGVNAGSFNDVYTGVRASRTLTPSLNAFAFYQFSDVKFSSNICAVGGCGALSTRHVIGVGLSWRPHPIRID